MGRPVGQKGINIPPKMHLLFLILNVIKKEKRNIYKTKNFESSVSCIYHQNYLSKALYQFKRKLKINEEGKKSGPRPFIYTLK